MNVIENKMGGNLLVGTLICWRDTFLSNLVVGKFICQQFIYWQVDLLASWFVGKQVHLLVENWTRQSKNTPSLLTNCFATNQFLFKEWTRHRQINLLTNWGFGCLTTREKRMKQLFRLLSCCQTNWNRIVKPSELLSSQIVFYERVGGV